MSRSKQKSTTEAEKIAYQQNPEGVPESARFIGVDAEDGRHYVVPHERVYVVEGDDVAFCQELDGRPLSHWCEFVGDRRGWSELNYSDESLGEWLMNALDDSAKTGGVL